MAPSEHTRYLQRLDARHHVHPFTNQKELARRGSRVIVRGEGCWLIDSEGPRLLDGMAGLWCVNVGYGRARLAEAAAAQMRLLPYYNTFFNSTTEPAVELAARLAGITPAGLDRFLLMGSGSEANDSLVKLVRWYWNRVGRPGKKLLVSRELAYHGTTLASASLSGLSNMHAGFDLPLEGFVHVPAPYAYGQDGLDADTVGVMAALALEQKILELGPERVAAFVAELIQGAGGVIIPPPATGPWSSASAASTTCCWLWTRWSAASAAPAAGSARTPSTSPPTR
jgi:putrescine---pyruvate transaminase